MIIGRFKCQPCGLPAARGHDVDVVLPVGIGIERNRLSVGRPAGRAGVAGAHRSELLRVRAVRIGHPDLHVAASIGLEGKPLPVRRELRVVIGSRRRGWEEDRRRPGRRAQCGEIDAPEILIRAPSDVDQSAPTCRPRTGNRRHDCALASEWQRSGRISPVTSILQSLCPWT